MDINNFIVKSSDEFNGLTNQEGCGLKSDVRFVSELQMEAFRLVDHGTPTDLRRCWAALAHHRSEYGTAICLSQLLSSASNELTFRKSANDAIYAAAVKSTVKQLEIYVPDQVLLQNRGVLRAKFVELPRSKFRRVALACLDDLRNELDDELMDGERTPEVIIPNLNRHLIGGSQINGKTTKTKDKSMHMIGERSEMSSNSLTRKFPLDIQSVPGSVMANVFSYLELRHVIQSVRIVCKTWFGVSTSRSYWTSIETLYFDEQWFTSSPRENWEALFRRLNNLKHLSLCVPFGASVIGDVQRLFEYITRKSPTQLESLKLTYAAHVCNEHLQLLAPACPLLTYLDLGYCNLISQIGLGSIVNLCPRIEALSLRCCDRINDWCLERIAQSLSNLQRIDLSCIGRITDRGIETLVNTCHTLRYINLRQCTQITNVAIIAIAEHCPQLTGIGIRGCKQVTEDGIHALGRHCLNLEAVNLRDLTNLTDYAVASLARGCCRLREVNLRGCTQLSDVGLMALARSCMHLETLNLWGCNRISDECLQYLVGSLPRLRFMDVYRCGTDFRMLYDLFLADLCPKLALKFSKD